MQGPRIEVSKLVNSRDEDKGYQQGLLLSAYQAKSREVE